MTILSVLPNSRALRAFVRLLTDCYQSRPCCYLLWLILHLQTCSSPLGLPTRSADGRVCLCACMSVCESVCVCALVPVFSVVHVGGEGWLANGLSDVVRGFYLIFGPREKERVTSWWMVNLNFQFIQKEKRGGGYEPSGETNLFPLGRAWFKLNITFSVKLVWRSLSLFFFFGAWFNSLMGCSFREEPFRPPLRLCLFPAAAHISLSFVLCF